MTAVPDLQVTLANGTQVPWTEFKTWSYQKQDRSVKGMSPESRKKMMETKQQNPQIHSDETRAKIRDSLAGKPKSPEHTQKISESKIGKKLTAKHRAKIKATLLAKPSNVKPIMTPSGVFPRLCDAIAYAKAHGVPNPRDKILTWLRTHPDQFYYVAKDTK